MSFIIESDTSSASATMPVLTKIDGARFKRPVMPGDTIEMQVKIKEVLSGVSFMRGNLRVAGKTAVHVDFACSLITPP